MASRKDFKVIIVGGSVSGMTLAHSLHHAGIDHVVLERGKQIAFEGGASIGLQPNGLRILDQMGMFPSILATTKPIDRTIFRSSDGTVISRSHFARQIEERHGYPILFFERSELLQILYQHYPRKENVLTDHEVVEVQSNSQGVTVTTKDGSTFKGDMVVGADGINSTVRRSLWNITRLRDPKAAKKAAESMTSQYYCAFGVSVHDFKDPELLAGSSQVLFNTHRSNIVISSTRNRHYWFLVIKHDKKYSYPDIPSFTTDEAESIMTGVVQDMWATETTSMKEIWDNRTKFAMVSLEEVVFEQWHESRIVLLGDSAHKVTPNAGHGGNTAIESAAALANLLHDAKSGAKGTLDYSGLGEIFIQYQETRNERVELASQASSITTRLQAWDNILWKAAARLLPILGEDFEANSASSLIMRGEPLKFIEYKGREGNIPWDGWIDDAAAKDWDASSTTRIVRNLKYLAIPAIVLGVIRQIYLTEPALLSSTPVSYTVALSNFVSHCLGRNGTQSFVMRIMLSHFPNQTLIDPWATFATCMNLLPVGTIVAIEGLRTNNAKTLSTIPWAGGISMQLCGFSAVTPLYFFAHCVEANLFSREPREYILPLKYSRSLPPAVLVSTTILLLLALLNTLEIFMKVDYLLSHLLLGILPQIFPLIPYIFTIIMGHSRHSNSRNIAFGHEDVSHVHAALLLSAVMSAMSHISRICATVFWAETAVFTLTPGSWLIHQIIGGSGLGDSIRLRYMYFVVGALIWCSLTTLQVLAPQRRTLKMKVKLSAMMLAGTVFVGSGASMALLWMWREDKTRCMEAQWRYAVEL